MNRNRGPCKKGVWFNIIEKNKGWLIRQASLLPVHMCMPCFPHSLIHLWRTMEGMMHELCAQIALQHHMPDSFLLAEYPNVCLLDLMVDLLKSFWGIYILLSKTPMQIYSFRNSARVFPFSHILVSPYYYLSFL